MSKETKQTKKRIDLTKVKEALDNTKRISKNLEHLVETISLAVVAFVTFWTGLNVELRTEYKYIALFSATVISLKALSEFLKHLNRK